MRLVATVTASFMILGVHASAQLPEYLTGVASLRGHRAIRVVIPEIADATDELTARSLQTRVELRLRRHGVSIPPADVPSSDTLAVLTLTVSLARLKTEPRVVYGINLDFDRLLEGVSPAGTPTVLRGTAYQGGTVGIVGTDGMEQVNVAVDELVEAFLNDYLSVNPK